MAIGDLLYRFRADARPLEQAAKRAERSIRDVGEEGERAGDVTVESTKKATQQMERLAKEAEETADSMDNVGVEVNTAKTSFIAFAGAAKAALVGVAAAVGALQAALERLDTVAEKARETLFETDRLSYRTGLTEPQQFVLDQLALSAKAEPEQLAEGLLAFREKIQLGSIPEEDLEVFGLKPEQLTERYQAGEFGNAVQLLEFITPHVESLIADRGRYEAASALETLAGADSQSLLKVIERGVSYEEQVAMLLKNNALLAPEEFEIERQEVARDVAIQQIVGAQLRAENRATLGARQALLETGGDLGSIITNPKALAGLAAYTTEFLSSAIRYPVNPVPFLETRAELGRGVTVNVEGSVSSQEDIADAVLRAIDAAPAPLTRQNASRTGLP